MIGMAGPLARKFTLSDLRSARASGTKVPMLTCYDYSTARLMQEAGVPMLLVGDSAANVILGHDTTLPVTFDFMMELTAAVRRGAPHAFVVADMPFGSYATLQEGVGNVCRMVKLSGCDCVKVEVGESHAQLVQHCADAGIAVMAHLGLRPQSVRLIGGYKFQGRTAEEAARIVATCRSMEQAGAAALLLEAVPPEVSERVVALTQIPVIGCGAGPACHASVFVTHDAIGFSSQRPRFVPQLGDVATTMKLALARYVEDVDARRYPAAEHQYEMSPAELAEFNKMR